MTPTDTLFLGTIIVAFALYLYCNDWGTKE